MEHPLYNKIMKRTKKFKAHDENNECGIGDSVMIMETRPFPRTRDGAWSRSSKRRSKPGTS